MLALVVAVGFSYRYELGAVADRLHGELIPSAAKTTEDGATQVRAQLDGHFYVMARADGRKIKFLVDTGASVTTLSLSDADSLGVDVERLAFLIPIETAGGSVRAAQVLIHRLELGDIVLDDVWVHVNEEPMSNSLLGINVLERLSSYEFRDSTLTLRQ